MAILENSFKWSFTSTGTGKAFDCRGYARNLTFGLETSSGCTATIVIQTRMGSSAGPYGAMGSTALSTGAFVPLQFSGPLEWVRPRVSDITAGSTHVITVYLRGN